MRISYTSLQLVFLSLLFATSSAAQEPPRIVAIRVEQGPVIDGVLDDAVWQRANVIDDFTQVEPRQGAAPSERTEIRILIDDETLYFGISCYDSEPEGIVDLTLQRVRYSRREDSDRRASTLQQPNFSFSDNAAAHYQAGLAGQSQKYR